MRGHTHHARVSDQLAHVFVHVSESAQIDTAENGFLVCGEPTIRELMGTKGLSFLICQKPICRIHDFC